MKKVRKLFTKDEIKKIINLWEDKTVEELAEELSRAVSSICYIARRVRKNGYPLSQKRKNGTLDLMIKEVIKEIK